MSSWIVIGQIYIQPYPPIRPRPSKELAQVGVPEMEIVRSNFRDSLRVVEDAIRKCVFVGECWWLRDSTELY